MRIPAGLFEFCGVNYKNMFKKNIIEIKSRDYWVKVIEMLQQNRALVEPVDGGAKVYFFDDDSAIFDEMTFPSVADAESGLDWNDFEKLAENKEMREFFRFPPEPPFYLGVPYAIYSTGEFWCDNYRRFCEEGR